MSAESGIDTFRGSKGSLWSGWLGNILLLYGGTPFGWNLTPSLVWSQFIKRFYTPIAEASPHDGYYALAAIQAQFFQTRMTVVTMNVDGFHQISGSNPVYEVHGSIKRFRCGNCNCRFPDSYVPTVEPPVCSSCGKKYPRPDVTLFTEDLPAFDWNKSLDSVSNLGPNDVILVVGTSSVVYPAASLPEIARSNGATIIEINPSESTPIKKGPDDIYIQMGAKDALCQIAQQLGIDESNFKKNTESS